MPLSDNLRGILLMCASMAAFTINDTFMKSVTQTLPLYQTIGLRGLIAVAGLDDPGPGHRGPPLPPEPPRWRADPAALPRRCRRNDPLS